MAVTPMNERAFTCFGDRDIEFAAFVNAVEGLGGTQAYRMTPEWLTSPDLMVFGSADEIEPGFGDGPFFFISVRPDGGDPQTIFARQWVTIRGHFGDPAATSCTATGTAGGTPNPEPAVAICQTMFVLTSIVAGAAPDTATAGPASASVDAESQRAQLPWLAAFAILGFAAPILVGRLIGRGRRSG
jgi:hypothetical protein